MLGWLRESQVELISLRESIGQDSAMGRAMVHRAIVFAEMESDLARERTLAGLERVRATGKHSGTSHSDIHAVARSGDFVQYGAQALVELRSATGAEEGHGAQSRVCSFALVISPLDEE